MDKKEIKFLKNYYLDLNDILVKYSNLNRMDKTEKMELVNDIKLLCVPTLKDLEKNNSTKQFKDIILLITELKSELNIYTLIEHIGWIQGIYKTCMILEQGE